ncbi:hypothetical protein [Winogradskyella aurantiaca]|uniref:hypothetical protein n=1 Tax=Winogradskyella aurantiaca TaxID=2219558 RepID=UPI0013009C43|nr:hypothetical protein [Winogradskyella aurantiaca]
MNVHRLLLATKLVFQLPKKPLSFNYEEKLIMMKREKRLTPFTYEQKTNYMLSNEWKLMQKIWLYQKGYRCQMFPFLVLGRHNIRGSHKNFYGPYAIHHVNRTAYKKLGMENLNTDVVVLSKFAHEFIYHYILSFGAKKVRDQKFVPFPNPLQVLANYWCFANSFLKLAILLLTILIIL